MIVDASAVLAIVLAEEDARSFSDAIAGADEAWISAVNWVEAAIRVDTLSLRPAFRMRA